MTYVLGIDLGTTFTAVAAVRDDGDARVVDLGNHAAAIPSLVFLRDDGTVLVGDAAARRGVAEPQRLAREFKRRVGDDVPIMLARTPYSAERLMGHLLAHVVAGIAEREGGGASAVAISHPANWGPFKVDLLRQAVNAAGLPNATFVTEPVAAAIQYASTERVEPGSVVAVYDLGGGTFDAAVLRKTADGFETLGEPQGIERLGGIDFDEAVFRHVLDGIGGIDHLDLGDASVRSALAHMRAECVAAKEALSADADAAVAVLLPGVNTQIRITRDEFEDMVRPALRETVEALRRALAAAKVDAADVDVVLLAGGSSRIPLITEMVRAELGRPVALDSHPKLAVALGAARLAAGDRFGVPATAPAPAETVTPSPAPAPAPARPETPVPVVAAPMVTPSAPPSVDLPPIVAAATTADHATTAVTASTLPTAPSAVTAPDRPATLGEPVAVPRPQTRRRLSTPTTPPPSDQRRRIALVVGVAVALIVAGGTAVMALGGDGGGQADAGGTSIVETVETVATSMPASSVPTDALAATAVASTTPGAPPPPPPTTARPRPATTTAPRVCRSASGRCVAFTMLEYVDHERTLVVGFRTINFDPRQDQRVRLVLTDEHGEDGTVDSNPGDDRFTVEINPDDPQYVQACLSVLVHHNEVEPHTEVCHDVPPRHSTTTTTTTDHTATTEPVDTVAESASTSTTP